MLASIIVGGLLALLALSALGGRPSNPTPVIPIITISTPTPTTSPLLGCVALLGAATLMVALIAIVAGQ